MDYCTAFRSSGQDKVLRTGATHLLAPSSCRRLGQMRMHPAARRELLLQPRAAAAKAVSSSREAVERGVCTVGQARKVLMHIFRMHSSMACHARRLKPVCGAQPSGGFQQRILSLGRCTSSRVKRQRDCPADEQTHGAVSHTSAAVHLFQPQQALHTHVHSSHSWRCGFSPPTQRQPCAAARSDSPPPPPPLPPIPLQSHTHITSAGSTVTTPVQHCTHACVHMLHACVALHTCVCIHAVPYSCASSRALAAAGLPQCCPYWDTGQQHPFNNGVVRRGAACVALARSEQVQGGTSMS